MSVLINDILPFTSYNNLPHIHEVFDVPQTHADDLNDLRTLLLKYDLSERVCVKLIHIHFKLNEGEVMTLWDVPTANHGPLSVLGPKKYTPKDGVLHGTHYFVNEDHQFQAYEYMAEEGPDMSKHGQLLAEFASLVVERGLQHKFGLSLKPRSEGSWMEFEYPQERTCINVPGPIPVPEGGYYTSTEWPREMSTEVPGGTVYRHCGHYSHGKKKADVEGAREDEDPGPVQPAYYPGQGVFTDGELVTLGGKKLDSDSSLYDALFTVTRCLSQSCVS